MADKRLRMIMTSLDIYESEKCFLEPEWVINIQTPVKDLDNFAKILGDKVILKQGNYSHCMYIRRGGHCRFMGNEGAHGGAESAVQEVDSAEIIISIPQDAERLDHVLNIINCYHVHEEPTVRITSAFGLRSRDLSNTDNPNKYWNRSDRDEIHGVPIK